MLRPFRAPETAYGRGHRGIDLAAAEGAAVLAVEGGVISHSGVIAGRGTVSVLHTDGLRSTYEPVVGMPPVGTAVEAGDRVGTLAAAGAAGAHCGARACLHLGARRSTAYLDPYPLLVGGRLALLPLG